MTRKESSDKGLLDSRFLDKSYREALSLTQDVAHYFEAEYSRSRPYQVLEGDEIFYASESMRLSACLMQVMSWFLVQKGVAAGEITPKESSVPKMRLGAQRICLIELDFTKGNLPENFIFYMQKAQDLYRQVERMDRMIYGDPEEENPVHALFNRLKNTDDPA